MMVDGLRDMDKLGKPPDGLSGFNRRGDFYDMIS